MWTSVRHQLVSAFTNAPHSVWTPGAWDNATINSTVSTTGHAQIGLVASTEVSKGEMHRTIQPQPRTAMRNLTASVAPVAAFTTEEMAQQRQGTCVQDGTAECTNLDGGFECQCLPGFEGDGRNGTGFVGCYVPGSNPTPVVSGLWLHRLLLIFDAVDLYCSSCS